MTLAVSSVARHTVRAMHGTSIRLPAYKDVTRYPLGQVHEYLSWLQKGSL